MGWKNVIKIADFTREELEELFIRAKEMKEARKRDDLSSKVTVLAFFEPSTRTRLSFKTAIHKLGGDAISIAKPEASSLAKGETFTDTVKILDGYGDCLIIRHKFEGAARVASDVAEHPVINGGDGSFHHPTQAMLDLFSIYELFGTIDGLTIGMIGDLKYARTIYSLFNGLSLFDPKRIYLIAPPKLGVREELEKQITKKKNCHIVQNTKDVIDELDILYVTRLQKERFPDPLEYKRVAGSYRVELSLLRQGKDNLKVLHPLPRREEISTQVDDTPYAAYFQQAKWGVPVRMALLSLVMETTE